jgi:hypothetical protein
MSDTERPSLASMGRRSVPASVMWSIITVMAGIIWMLSGRSSQLDTMTTQLAVISGQIGKLSDSYNATDRIVGIQTEQIKNMQEHLGQVEVHLRATDAQIERLEK